MSILLTLVFASCGNKKASTSLTLSYNEQGIIVSSIIADETPLHEGEQPYTAGERLLSTDWSQSSPYNSHLPKVGSKPPPVGCANTAIAQVMYYFKDKIKPSGVFKGKLHDNEAWADFNTPIHWELIQSNPSKHQRKAQNDELALLFKNLVVINKTSLATSESGGSGTTDQNLMHAIKHYLGFDASLEVLSANTGQLITSGIEQRLIESIKNKTPVILSTQGSLAHGLIIDGYQIKDDEVLFHLNFGWGGLHNGFYNLNQPLTVTEEFSKPDGSRWERTLESSDFSFYLNLNPCNEDCKQFNEDGDVYSNHTISGSLDKVFDEDYFGPFSASDQVQINLDYRIKPFYVSAINEYGEVIAEDNSSFSFSSSTPYKIRVSPKSAQTNSYYPSISNYSFNILASEVLTNSPKQDFQLYLDTQSLSLNSANTIRVLSKSYIPSHLKITIEGDELSDESYSINNNLITFNPDSFLKNRVYQLKISLKDDSHFYSSFEVELIRTEDDLSIGSKQVLRGQFSSQNDKVIFKTVLKGNCSIKGDRGFSNQGFFINFDNRGFTEVYQDTQDLNLNIYTLQASLSSGTEAYMFNSNKNDFSIEVDCENSHFSFSELVQIL